MDEHHPMTCGICLGRINRAHAPLATVRGHDHAVAATRLSFDDEWRLMRARWDVEDGELVDDAVGW